MQGDDPLFHRGELQHIVDELWGNEEAHTSSLPLTAGNAREMGSPACEEMGSRAQAMCGGELKYKSTRYLLTSGSGFFPSSEMTFHVPTAKGFFFFRPRLLGPKTSIATRATLHLTPMAPSLNGEPKAG